jgi:glucose/arabinose dehydrogenase
MTAGRGILHEEFHSPAFTRSGGAFRMLQLWVNLPAKLKMSQPSYQAVLDGQIKSVELPDGAGRVRVIAGAFDGVHGPARTFTPINVWDLRLAGGKSASLDLPEGHTAILVVLSGAVRVESGQTVGEGQIALLSREGRGTTVMAESDDLYVANTDAIMRFPYVPGETRITSPGVKLTDLPAGPIDHHWTKSLTASPDGSKLYVGVGSNSNITENGIAVEEGRAAIWEVDRRTGLKRLYAGGLRNPTGVAFEPQTGKLWAIVNERDEIGPNLVPDYLTSVREGGFYGWPYSYFGQHVDVRAQPQRPDLVAKALPPDYALSSHVAPLGMVFSQASSLPTRYRGGVFVAEHGSWDRSPLNGYKVVYVPFQAGRPSGPPQDVVTGFLTQDEKKSQGRPVGLALDHTGALLIADDVGNAVWRVSADAIKGQSRPGS